MYVEGVPVNAVLVTNMLLKLVEDLPERKGGGGKIAVIFDAAKEPFKTIYIPITKLMNLIL